MRERSHILRGRRASRSPPTAARRAADALDVHVGERIRQRRQQLGLSARMLAEAARVSFGTILQYERGELPVDPQQFGRLSGALAAPISYFFLDFQPPSQSAETINETAQQGEDMYVKSLALASCFAVGIASARAEVSEITLVRQPAFAFLPLVVMQADHLVEKHARDAGLGDIKVNYVSMNNGAAVNAGLLSHTVSVAAGGMPPFLTMWDRTRDTAQVKALRAVTDAQQYLVTRNPKVRTVADFGDDDRINVQAPGAAMPSILLQMAAAQAFGMQNYAKLDPLMVGLSGPDGVAALLSSKGQVTADFANPPFTYEELDAPGNHLVLKTDDLFGGHVTTAFLYTTSAFYDENPKTVAAILAAYDEAVGIVEKDRHVASDAFAKIDWKPVDIGRMIDDPAISFTQEPHGIMKFADFLHQTGQLHNKPSSWQETFFKPEAERFHGD